MPHFFFRHSSKNWQCQECPKKKKKKSGQDRGIFWTKKKEKNIFSEEKCASYYFVNEKNQILFFYVFFIIILICLFCSITGALSWLCLPEQFRRNEEKGGREGEGGGDDKLQSCCGKVNGVWKLKIKPHRISLKVIKNILGNKPWSDLVKSTRNSAILCLFTSGDSFLYDCIKLEI